MWPLCPRLLFFLVVAGLSTISYCQNQPAADRSAVFKTIVPHHKAAIAGVRGARAVSQGTAAASLTAFSGPPYMVGATITPTATAPEAEEHIAVDPSNFHNLVAMISDFSILRAEFLFNTSTFAVSMEPPYIYRLPYSCRFRCGSGNG